MTITWIKSSKSVVGGEIHECVEVGHGVDGVFVRDSKNPDGAWLHVPEDAWQLFLRQCAGE